MYSRVSAGSYAKRENKPPECSCKSWTWNRECLLHNGAKSEKNIQNTWWSSLSDEEQLKLYFYCKDKHWLYRLTHKMPI